MAGQQIGLDPSEPLGGLDAVMLVEGGTALLLGIFFEIDALVIVLMAACFIAHEFTSYWDLAYAEPRRHVAPIEQHVHSFLEMIPLMAIVAIVGMHWGQFLALFGLGDELARFGLVRKAEPLPMLYVAAVFAAHRVDEIALMVMA